MYRYLSIAMILVLGGCAWLPAKPEEPASIGRGTDDYKPSRCACEILMVDGFRV